MIGATEAQAEAAALVAAAARVLREAEATGVACPPLRETFPALDVALAYQVQAENTRLALGDSGRIVGRKIGLTARSVQAQLGVDRPDCGTVRADMCAGDGEEISWARLMQPRAEAEVAVVLGRDLDVPGVTFAEAVRAVEYALPAIEVVGSRIAGWNIQIVDTVADNASSSMVVLGGAPRRLGDFDPRLCGMVIERRGEPVSLGAGAACLGHPINALVWLANQMIALGTPLAAGDLVLTGALGPMVTVAQGDALEARISGLGSVRAMFGGGGRS
jgi:2-keto-4-pentenoate hydratase